MSFFSRNLLLEREKELYFSSQYTSYIDENKSGNTNFDAYTNFLILDNGKNKSIFLLESN